MGVKSLSLIFTPVGERKTTFEELCFICCFTKRTSSAGAAKVMRQFPCSTFGGDVGRTGRHRHAHSGSALAPQARGTFDQSFPPRISPHGQHGALSDPHRRGARRLRPRGQRLRGGPEGGPGPAASGDGGLCLDAGAEERPRSGNPGLSGISRIRFSPFYESI